MSLYKPQYNLTKISQKSFILLLICYMQSIPAQNQKLIHLENKVIEYHYNDTNKVDILNNIGYEYWIVNPEKSIIAGKKALNISKKIDYKNGFAKANRIIGVAHWAQGNHKEALQYLLVSQEKYKKMKNYEGVADTTLNIGLVYADLKEYEEALKKYDEAINLFMSLKLTNRIATTYSKIATILIEQQEKNIEALEYLTKALEIHVTNNFTYGIAEVHNRLASLYLNENNPNQAFYYIKKSIQLGTEIKDNYGLTSGMILLGKILILKGKFYEAERSFKKGLQSAKENNLKLQELSAYQELKKLKVITKEPKEALFFYNKFVTLKDTLFNYKKSKEIAFLDYKNKLEQTSKKITFLEEQQRKKKTINKILISSVLLVFIGTCFVLYMYRKRSEKKIESVIKKQDLLKFQNSLAQKFIRNEKLKQKELEQQLEFKNKQLTSYTFNFQQKNKIISQVENIVKDLDKVSSLDGRKLLIQELKKLVKENFSIDSNWECFRDFFEETQVGFHAKLKLKHKGLRANDLKICSLIRINLNIKETANILGISPGSLKTARYRLRKKLNLKPGQEIIDYLILLEKEEYV